MVSVLEKSRYPNFTIRFQVDLGTTKGAGNKEKNADTKVSW